MPKSLKNFVPVEGFDLYMVDPYGRVYSLYKKKLLKPYTSSFGYWKLVLYNEDEKVNKKIHRLVAAAFIDNPDTKPQVNHKNGNKKDNRVSNLEWVTTKENTHHAWETGLCSSVLTSKEVAVIWSRRNLPLEDTAKLFGVSRVNISRIYSGKIWAKEYAKYSPIFPNTRILTKENILYIKDNMSSVSKKTLANQFSVSTMTISRIINGVGKYSNV